MDPRQASTEQLIRYGLRQFEAERRERFVHAAGRGMHTHSAGEKVLHLPNGATVKVTTCEAAVVTHVEEDEHLHAVARPRPVPMPPELADRVRRILFPNVSEVSCG